MRIWDIITGKARRERKEAEARRARQDQAKRDEDHIRSREDAFRSSAAREIDRRRPVEHEDRWHRPAPGVAYRRETTYGTAPPPAPDITSPLNPANPFYGTGYGVSGHHSAPDCSPSSSSSGYSGDSGGSCGGGDGGGGGGGGGD